MAKIIKQLTVTDRFVSIDPLSGNKQLKNNNKGYRDLVFNLTQDTDNHVQEKGKAYYAEIKLPYDDHIPSAFLFKIRDTSTVKDSSILDFENDTHQVVKYAETPYLGSKNEDSSNTLNEPINMITVGYTLQNIGRRYQSYTYDQLKKIVSTYNIDNSPFPEESDFNNLASNVKNIITTIIKATNNPDPNESEGETEEYITNIEFDIQKLNNAITIGTASKYITFNFIFIPTISWNEFICCYDRDYNTDNRVLNVNDTNITIKIYPFSSDSDLIKRSSSFPERILHNSSGTIDKITLRVYNSNNVLIDNVPFYINNQSFKIGPSKQFIFDATAISTFGIPNINNNICVIEYEYEDE